MTDVGSVTATSVHIDEYYSIVEELIVQLSHSGDAFVKDNTTAFQISIEILQDSPHRLHPSSHTKGEGTRYEHYMH